MDELSLEQSVVQLLQKVPKPIHDFVLNDLSEKTRELMERYELHVDQAGILQRELLLMLLGQVEPADFMKALREVGISQEVVQLIVMDVNEEVFKPLREEERSQGVAPTTVPEPQLPRPNVPTITAPAAPQAAPPTIPATPPPVPTPEPELPKGHTMQSDMQTAYPTQPQQPQAWQPYPPQYPQPQYVPFGQPYMPVPMPQPQVYWVPVSVAPQQPVQYPQPPVQQPPPPSSAPPTPAPEPPRAPEPPPPPPIPAPEPQTWAPPPNLPTGMPEEPQAPIPLRKEYGADPYREPV